MMPHGRADYQEMVEAQGFEKAVDMLAYHSDPYKGSVSYTHLTLPTIYSV